MVRRISVWVVLLGVAVSPLTAWAQGSRGAIQGRVVDATGAGVGGAEVVIAAAPIGVRVASKTDDLGWFVVASLDPSSYDVEVRHSGFRTLLQTVTVAVNQTVRVTLTLQPGPVSEVVTVSAGAAPLDRDPPALTARITPDRVSALPLDGRNFLDLALLVAGSAPPAQGSAGSVRGDFAFTVNGAREDANVFLLDGVYNLDPKLNSAAIRPPVEAIREFEVVTSTPDASLGRSAGAHVNIITRSGTNELSLTGYDFARTSAFNARNAFAPASEPAPDYRRHQFGAAGGGALRRDRVFVFADYEGTRLREGITRVTNVPTLAERSGDFSQSLFPAPVDPFFRQPFPGNAIPDFLQNPIGRAIAALYPEPNRNAPFANFVSSPALTDDVNQADVRLDVRTSRATLTSRYSVSDRALFEPFAGPGFSLVPGFGTDVPRRAHNVSVSESRAIGGRMMNDVRVGWTRVSSSALHEGRGASLNTQVGLPELSANARDFGLSFISVAGFSPLGDEFNNPQDSTVDLWQVGDTLTWTPERHLVRIGGEFRGLRQQAFRDVQSRGFLQFTNQAFTGNALADLLLGLPTVTGGARVDNPQDLRAHSYAFFVQDSFQASPNLTLSAGVRYEFNAPPVDARDRVTLYDPATGTLVAAGTNGMPRSGYLPDRNNLAPRLGAAWAIDDETVVRGGYGISYDQAALAPNEFLYFNSPFFDLNLYFTVPPDFVLTLFDPFPANFPLFTPDSATTVQRDLQTGFLHQWHASVQRSLGPSRTVEIGYVGSRGRNLIAARDINQPAPSQQFPNLRPNPLFADITAIESRARSEYDALQLRFDQRLHGGVALSTSYTLGSSMDDASGFFSSAGDANFPMDSNAPSAEWARSNFDVRHRFTLSGLWEIPIGPDRRFLRTGLGATCLGNWDLYVVASANSGRPFTVAIHPDVDNSNTGRANLGFGANDRPNLIGNPALASPSADAWFNAAAFGMPAFGTFGDVGRNSLEGPGFKNVNLSLARQVPFSRGVFQIRLEIFNVFNWTNLDQPDNFFLSPTFGQILSAGSPRRLQLGLKYAF